MGAFVSELNPGFDPAKFWEVRQVAEMLCMLGRFSALSAEGTHMGGRSSHMMPALRLELPSTAGRTPAASLTFCLPPSLAYARPKRSRTLLGCALSQERKLILNSSLTGSRFVTRIEVPNTFQCQLKAGAELKRPSTAPGGV